MKTIKLNQLVAKTVKNNSEVIFKYKQKMDILRKKYDEYMYCQQECEYAEEAIKRATFNATGVELTSDKIISFEKVPNKDKNDNITSYKYVSKWIHGEQTVCIEDDVKSEEPVNNINE